MASAVFRRRRSGQRRQVAQVAGFLARGLVSGCQQGLEVLQGHRLAGVTGKRQAAVHGRLHGVEFATEHSVEYGRAHAQAYVGSSRNGPQARARSISRKLQVKGQGEVAQLELHRDLVVLSLGCQLFARRNSPSPGLQLPAHALA